MRERFRIFRRRSGIFYLFDTENNRQESLKTKDKDAASRVLHARNESVRDPRLNLQIARAYLSASDQELRARTWGDAIRDLTEQKQGETKKRWLTAQKDKALNELLARVIAETPQNTFIQSSGPEQ